MSKIAVICSQFNEEVTTLLREGALEQFKTHGLSIPSEDVFLVPGAIEIPVVASCLAQKKIYDAILCLGAVIRGETTHYDYVCWQVSYGCQKISIDHKLPVIFGVLTTENDEQALNRCGGTHGHKGKDCADATVQMINLFKKMGLSPA